MTSSTDPAALIEGGIEWDKVAQGYSEMASFMASLPRIERTREEVRSLLGTTPADEIYREHSVTLRRYRGQGARRGEPVLMVPSLVNRSWIMDFLPGESMAEYLSRQRFDVFLLDWGMPNPGQRQLKLEYYLDHYLDRVVKRTLKAASARTCHLLGYCLGGTMSALYLASRADAPVTSFISMTTPVNFVDRGILSWWSRPGHFDADKLVNTFGNIPDTFFRMSFPWIVPTAPLKKLRTLIERHNDPAYLKSFLALDIWLADNVPFPGEVYRQVIKDLYQ
ncbi:MAG: alpha/beta fold hydrolase, partial [Candidatus Riflebacteria bacterium]|nr:alpha/beta fold hydrolase [Candidatus Riflebacteria bacterium]